MGNRGAVLITGASSGIGEACALRLDKAGFQVFASVLSAAEGAQLQKQACSREACSRLQTFVLDLTDAQSIQDALDTVSRSLGQNKLRALINNAGVLGCAPLELLSMSATRQVFEVNVIGQIALTQAFLPLLRREKGCATARIINIGSLAGRSALPFTGPYNASKWAFRSLNNTWRTELHPQGIRVVLIEPGMVKTPIWKGKSAILREVPERTRQRYAAFFDHSAEVEKIANQTGVSASEVAEVVLRAIVTSKPKPRYGIGREARLLLFVEALPTPLRDWLVRRHFEL